MDNQHNATFYAERETLRQAALAPDKVWVVTAPSAIHMGVCFLGRGATRAAAIADAYGPTPNRRSMSRASIYETTSDDADELENGVYR